MNMSVYSTRERAAMYERLAARGLAEAARDSRRDILCAYADLVSALRALKDAGVDVGDSASTLDVEIAKRDADLCKVIDAAGEHAGELDTSELRGMA